MIHQFFLVGTIKKISVSEPKDPKKGPSAVVLVQYGKQRETTGNSVEFVNAVMVRIPNFKYPQLKDKLQVGARIQINGHKQGVFKAIIDDGFFSTELVADQVYLNDEVTVVGPVHAFYTVGTIKKISVSEPKDKTKNPSAVILVQYGKQRETTGNSVEFVNAAMIRVPSFKYPQLKDKLRVGANVQINGKLQGVFKTIIEDGYFTVELVADHVYVNEEAAAAPVVSAE